MKKILYLILFAVLFFPLLASAQITITGMVSAAVSTAQWIASGLVIILWLLTGVLFLVAQGAPEKLNLARKALFTSIAGTVIVIIAAVAMDVVGKAFGI